MHPRALHARTRFRFAFGFLPAAVMALVATLLPALVPVPAAAQDPGIGFSSELDLYCGFERDLDITIAAPNTLVESSVFIDDPGSFFSMGCTFCISDKNAVDVGSMSVTELLPASWTIPALENSVDNDTLPVSAAIQTQFPDYVCWLFRGVDFTFSSPFFAPDEMFTFSVTAHADFRFAIDPENSGWFKTDLSSGFFTVCDSLTSTGSSPFVGVAGPAVPIEEESSWSGVKALFR